MPSIQLHYFLYLLTLSVLSFTHQTNIPFGAAPFTRRIVLRPWPFRYSFYNMCHAIHIAYSIGKKKLSVLRYPANKVTKKKKEMHLLSILSPSLNKVTITAAATTVTTTTNDDSAWRGKGGHTDDATSAISYHTRADTHNQIQNRGSYSVCRVQKQPRHKCGAARTKLLSHCVYLCLQLQLENELFISYETGKYVRRTSLCGITQFVCFLFTELFLIHFYNLQYTRTMELLVDIVLLQVKCCKLKRKCNKCCKM